MPIVLRMQPHNLKLEEHRSTTDGSKDRQAAFELEGVEVSRRKQAEIKNKTIGGVKKKEAIFPARHWFISPVPEKTLPPHKPPNLSSPDSQHIYIQQLNMPVSTIRMHTDYTRSPAANPAGHHKKNQHAH